MGALTSKPANQALGISHKLSVDAPNPTQTYIVIERQDEQHKLSWLRKILFSEKRHTQRSVTGTSLSATECSSAAGNSMDKSSGFWYEEECTDEEEEEMLKDCLIGRTLKWNKPRLVSSFQPEDVTYENNFGMGMMAPVSLYSNPKQPSQQQSSQQQNHNVPDMRLSPSNTSSVASSSSGDSVTNEGDDCAYSADSTKAGVGWGLFDTSVSGTAAAVDSTFSGYLQQNRYPKPVNTEYTQLGLMQATTARGNLRKSQATMSGLNEMVFQQQQHQQSPYLLTTTPTDVEGSISSGELKFAPIRSYSIPVACPKPSDNLRKEWEDEDAKARESIYSRATWRMYHRIMTARNERAATMATTSVPVVRNTSSVAAIQRNKSETKGLTFANGMDHIFQQRDGLNFGGLFDSPLPSPLGHGDQGISSSGSHHSIMFPLSLDL